MLFALSHWNGLRTDLACTVRFVLRVSRDSGSFAMIDAAASVRPIAISSLLPRYAGCFLSLFIDSMKLFCGVEESFGIILLDSL